MRRLSLLAIASSTLALFGLFFLRGNSKPAEIVLTIETLDDSTGQDTPARLEVRDDDGRFYIATDAMHVGIPLRDDPEPLEVNDLETYVKTTRQRVKNHYARSEQFYSPGICHVTLPPGRYRVRGFKGIEYRVADVRVDLESESARQLDLHLERWIDMPSLGWFSADDHLHIPRPTAQINPHIAAWMEAEDIHVSNLLQWGHSRHFHNAIQYAHGPTGTYRAGNTILFPGQENPRTHFLGHTILLGAQKAINFAESYLLYRKVFEEGHRQGSVNGYAHHGIFFHAQNGLALDLPTGLVDFIEVLQGGTADYSVWYLALNSGFRITPLAGTDYPVGPIPGWERFYAKVTGPYSAESWLDAVRRGRVFVTNGPILDFEVGEAQMGGELRLQSPQNVRIRGSVLFDPHRDSVDRLELVQNGTVIHAFHRNGDQDSIRFDIPFPIDRPGWMALRASGEKGDCVIYNSMRRQPSHSGPSGEPNSHSVPAPSLAHTSPIYVSIGDQPAFVESPEARTAAWAWVARLRDLDGSLRTFRLPNLVDRDVPMELLKANQAELQKVLRESEAAYVSIIQP